MLRGSGMGAVCGPDDGVSLARKPGQTWGRGGGGGGGGW